MEGLKGDLLKIAREAGAQKCGFATASAVDDEAVKAYDRWLAEGKNADMAYLEKYADVRNNPQQLLDDPTCARTIMVCAFSYYHPETQADGAARIAMYAHGDDYHEVLRRRMQPLVARLQQLGYGARICVDTAPLRERYWAVKAGVGFRGRNGQLIVDGMGSYFFLATLITDAAIEPDEPCRLSCLGCDRCVHSCPGGAIGPGGTIDARRCLSYLTIEHRGELPATALGGRVYGCDECQRVCPHNLHAPVTEIEEFHLRPTLRTLTADDILGMSQEDFSRTFTHSAIKRAKLAGLQRNARALKGTRDEGRGKR